MSFTGAGSFSALNYNKHFTDNSNKHLDVLTLEMSTITWRLRWQTCDR